MKKKEGKEKRKVRASRLLARAVFKSGAFRSHPSRDSWRGTFLCPPLCLSLSILLYSLPPSFSGLCMAANWAVSLAYAVASPSGRQIPDRLLKAHYCEVLRRRTRNFSSPIRLSWQPRLSHYPVSLLSPSLSSIFSFCIGSPGGFCVYAW